MYMTFLTVIRALNMHSFSDAQYRYSNTLAEETIEKHRSSELSHTKVEEDAKPQTEAPPDYK